MALIHRKKDAEQTDACPFCGKAPHRGLAGPLKPYGLSNERYRQTRAGQISIRLRTHILATDGTLLRFADGYRLKDY